MKNLVIIAAVSVGSFLLLLMVALLMLLIRPEVFGSPSPNDKPESVRNAGVKSDSAKTTVADTAVAVAQSSQIVPARDSSNTLTVTELSNRAKSLQTQLDSLKQLEAKKTDPAKVPQKDWKATAQLLESMNAEDAGKILKQMKDNEIKEVLSRIKKRQAGKILAILDPVRAARILR